MLSSSVLERNEANSIMLNVNSIMLNDVSDTAFKLMFETRIVSHQAMYSPITN